MRDERDDVAVWSGSIGTASNEPQSVLSDKRESRAVDDGVGNVVASECEVAVD